MGSALRRGATFSGLLHAAILLALLASLPPPAPDQPPAADIEFEILSAQPRQVAKAAQQAPEPAAAAASTAPPAAPPKPVAHTPPPTPPAAAAVPRSLPPPPIPPPPVQPRDVTALPTPTPPVPIKPPPPLPTPPRQPPPAASPPAPASPATPPSVAKTASPDTRLPDTHLPDTHLIESTLDRLRSAERQAQSAAAKAAAAKAGGSPTGDINAKLTGEQRGAIGDKVRECWTKDPGALDLEKMSVTMTVTLDAGVVRDVEVGAADRGKLANPRFRVFAERAARATLDPHCADLSNELPKSELGHKAQLTLHFRP